MVSRLTKISSGLSTQMRFETHIVPQTLVHSTTAVYFQKRRLAFSKLKAKFILKSDQVCFASLDVLS